MRILLISALIFSAPVAVRAHDAAQAIPGKNSQVENEIRQLENRRFQAMVAVDAATLEQILANELTYTHSTGRVETKGEFLAALKSGQVKYESIDVRELNVQMFGIAAVVTGRAAVQVQARGQKMSFQIRFTDVYVKEDGRWRMVAWQSTRLPEEKKD